MMMRPQRYWVGNVRTVWSHLAIKHQVNQRLANEELYNSGDWESEMSYKVRRDVYVRIGPDILTLGRLAAEAAQARGVRPGRLLYMWRDAVASVLFDRFASTRATAR